MSVIVILKIKLFVINIPFLGMVLKLEVWMALFCQIQDLAVERMKQNVMKLYCGKKMYMCILRLPSKMRMAYKVLLGFCC